MLLLVWQQPGGPDRCKAKINGYIDIQAVFQDFLKFLRLVTMGTYERMAQTLKDATFHGKKAGDKTWRNISLAVFICLCSTLVWDLLPALMCVLNLWHWASLPAPAGASQPWLPFTSSFPVSTKYLVSDFGRVALLHASLLPIHGAFAAAQMPHQKEGKIVNITDVQTHNITSWS